MLVISLKCSENVTETPQSEVVPVSRTGAFVQGVSWGNIVRGGHLPGGDLSYLHISYTWHVHYSS